VKRDEKANHNVTVAKNLKSYYSEGVDRVIAHVTTVTLENSLLLGCVYVFQIEMHG
jgi:hypothetical protein